MNKILDNRDRAKNATICFYIMLGMYVVMLISDFMEYRLLTGDLMSLYNGAEANDNRQLIIAVISFGAQIALIITFIQWLRRGYHNLHKAGVKNLIASEGWAAGAWFVPILNLFRPYQIMKEIWDHTKKYGNDLSTDNSFEDYEADSSSQSGSDSTVGLWWAFWIISSITANISYQMVKNGETMETFQNSSLLGIVADVAGIVSIFFAIKMIKESQLHQNKFYEASKNNSNDSFVLPDSDEILV